MRRIGHIEDIASANVDLSSFTPAPPVTAFVKTWFSDPELDAAARRYLAATQQIAKEYLPAVAKHPDLIPGNYPDYLSYKAALAKTPNVLATDLPGWSAYDSAERVYEQLLPADLPSDHKYAVKYGKGTRAREEGVFMGAREEFASPVAWEPNRGPLRFGVFQKTSSPGKIPNVAITRGKWGSQTVPAVATPTASTVSREDIGQAIIPAGQPGSRDKDNVKRLQKALTRAGFPPKTPTGAIDIIDGVYGKGTISAVKAFQKSYGKGLEVDGVAGPGTIAALTTVSAAGLGVVGNPTSQLVGAVAGAVLGYNYGSKGMSKEASAVIGGIGGLLLGRWLGG